MPMRGKRTAGRPTHRRGFGTGMIQTGLAPDLGAKVALGFRPAGLVRVLNSRTQIRCDLIPRSVACDKGADIRL